MPEAAAYRARSLPEGSADLVSEMLLALKAAIPHIERVAAQSPTTDARMSRKRDASRALERMSAVIAKAEASDPA